jgi:selenocysteine lyase/cysteine desulfurase
MGDVTSTPAHLRDRTREIHAAMHTMTGHEQSLSRRLVSGLQAIDAVEVRGITDPEAVARRVPTVSFTHPTLDPAEIATHLDRHGVYVWNGHSYALPVVEFLGIADRGGVVRVGPTHYNTLAEVDAAVELVADFVRHHA